MKPLIITGVFGTAFFKCHPSPDGFQCVLFSNNEKLKEEAEVKGWEFQLVRRPGMELSDDEATSSIQSKWIKFINFREEFPEYFLGQPILWVDHKIPLTNAHVSYLQENIAKNKSILVTNTPRIKNKLSDEIEEAMHQNRYRFAMPQTLEWIDSMKRARGISEHVRIMRTGLIYYADLMPVKEVLDEVYEVIDKLKQPECQIIWAVLSQSIERLIQRVEWSELGIEDRLP
jgi:hypothetical protein